jgi:hypothetical protein
MGHSLKNEFPQIKNACRLDYTGSLIKQGENVFGRMWHLQTLRSFDMFDFPVKWAIKLPSRVKMLSY